MSLKRALRLKNKMVETVNNLKTKITTFNRVTKANQFRDDVQRLFNELMAARDNLIQIKTAIAIASSTIRNFIVEMGELRDHLTFLRSINTDDSSVEEHPYRLEPAKEIQYKVALTYGYIENAIKATQTRIDEIQDKIDEYNATTMIELAD